MFNYGKLKGRIAEKEMTRTELAQLLGIKPQSLSAKFNNKHGFSQKDIWRISEILDIDIKDISEYFFAFKTEKTQDI